MSLPIELIKYGLFVVILIVMSFKIFTEVQKIIKRFKNKGEASLGFDLEVK